MHAKCYYCLGYGLISLGPITLTPFRGNFQNSSILFNGEALIVKDVEWAVCEGVRTAQGTLTTSSHHELKVTNKVRAVFEDYAILQKWDIQSSSHAWKLEQNKNQKKKKKAGPFQEQELELSLLLDGPYFRFCDQVRIILKKGMVVMYVFIWIY